MEEPQRVAEGKGKRRTRIIVTEDDLKILKFIHDYRLLRIEQLEALTGRTYTRVHRRVKGLFDADYLKRREVPQKKDIYYVGRRALALLLSHGLISEEEAVRRSREHELRPDTLDHEMMISDVHLTLELATKPGPQTLIAWREGETICDTFEVGGFQAQKVVISPDAFFQLKDTRLEAGKDSRIYFLEADRSTMLTKSLPGSRRFRDKVERYRLFIERGRPFEKYGVQAVRIVTLTLTRERRDNLCADTEKFLSENNLTKLRKFFLFGTIKDISLAAPSTILEPLFIRPGSTKVFPLFPSLAETAEGA
jgi:protein involved in plasmid replication-relaxation